MIRPRSRHRLITTKAIRKRQPSRERASAYSVTCFVKMMLRPKSVSPPSAHKTPAVLSSVFEFFIFIAVCISTRARRRRGYV